MHRGRPGLRIANNVLEQTDAQRILAFYLASWSNQQTPSIRRADRALTRLAYLKPVRTERGGLNVEIVDRDKFGLLQLSRHLRPASQATSQSFERPDSPKK